MAVKEKIRDSRAESCLKTRLVAGPCLSCKEFQKDGVHLMGLKIYCERHCRACHKKEEIDWDTEAPVVVAAVQESLF